MHKLQIASQGSSILQGTVMFDCAQERTGARAAECLSQQQRTLNAKDCFSRHWCDFQGSTQNQEAAEWL